MSVLQRYWKLKKKKPSITAPANCFIADRRKTIINLKSRPCCTRIFYAMPIIIIYRGNVRWTVVIPYNRTSPMENIRNVPDIIIIIIIIYGIDFETSGRFFANEYIESNLFDTHWNGGNVVIIIVLFRHDNRRWTVAGLLIDANDSVCSTRRPEEKKIKPNRHRSDNSLHVKNGFCAVRRTNRRPFMCLFSYAYSKRRKNK